MTSDLGFFRVFQIRIWRVSRFCAFTLNNIRFLLVLTVERRLNITRSLHTNVWPMMHFRLVAKAMEWWRLTTVETGEK